MIQSQFKLKGTPSSALLGATLGFFFGVMAISLFGPTSTTLGAAMGLGATELGLLVSVPSLTGSLLRIPFGAMVDSNGGRRGFLFLLAAAVVGLGALSLLFTLYPVETPGSMRDLYPVVLLLGCLAGCGIATFSVGASQSNYWFVKSRQGYASGIYGGLGTTSAGILAFALPLLLHHFGFTAAYYILTGVMLLGLLLYIWLGANPPYFQFLKAGKSAEVARDNALACGQEPTSRPSVASWHSQRGSPPFGRKAWGWTRCLPEPLRPCSPSLPPCCACPAANSLTASVVRKSLWRLSLCWLLPVC